MFESISTRNFLEFHLRAIPLFSLSVQDLSISVSYLLHLKSQITTRFIIDNYLIWPLYRSIPNSALFQIPESRIPSCSSRSLQQLYRIKTFQNLLKALPIQKKFKKILKTLGLEPLKIWMFLHKLNRWCYFICNFSEPNIVYINL